MWSTPQERAEAERRARPLTKAQQAERIVREHAFNAGFDAAVRALTSGTGVPVHYSHPRYIKDRRERFERWERACAE